MTGPDPGAFERGTGAPPRSTGIQEAVGVVLIALALGLAVRLILLYLLPGSGFGPDLASFRFWANDGRDSTACLSSVSLNDSMKNASTKTTRAAPTKWPLAPSTVNVDSFD